VQIELMQLEKLRPYANNARNNEKAVDVVVNSIKEFGFKNPILIDIDKVGSDADVFLLRCGEKIRYSEVKHKNMVMV
jgi:hypothetical protein